MLALSTAWFKQSESSLDDLFALLIEQGFHAFELNHVVHPLDPDEFNGMIAHHRFEITSLHNVCSSLADPLEPDNRYGDNLAALDETARRQGVIHLRSTAEAALQLGAKARPPALLCCGQDWPTPVEWRSTRAGGWSNAGGCAWATIVSQPASAPTPCAACQPGRLSGCITPPSAT